MATNRTFILLVGLFLNLSCLFSQNNPPKVYLELSKPVIRDGQFICSIKITNSDTLSYTIFKPSVDEICNQTLQFYYINKINNMKFQFTGSCTGIHQLGGVPLTVKNSLYLNPNESFIKEFRFPKEDMEFFYKKGFTFFYAEYFLADVNFISFFDNILKTDLISNEVELGHSDNTILQETR